MASTKSIVIPAVRGASSVTCVQSLGRRGIHTVVASERESTPAFRSRYCDEAVVVPSPFETPVEYKDALLALARRTDVKAIIPMREIDIYVLSKYRHQFETHMNVTWPSFEKLRQAHDRIRLVAAAKDAEVPVPETWLFDEVDDWNRKLITKARYPLLTNEYVETVPPGEVVFPPRTRYLQPSVEPNREEIRLEMKHVPIVQEYVPGTEYSFWALYDRGEPLATCHKRQIRGDSYAGGTSVYRETCHISELEAVGRALLDHLDWHGLAAAQFMRDAETGEFKLLELNPRMWISVSAAVRAGANFPYYYWRLASGDSAPKRTEYRDGVATHDFYGEIGHLLTILRGDSQSFVERPEFRTTAWKVVSSLYDQPHLDYFCLDDPRPFVRRTQNVVTIGAVTRQFEWIRRAILDRTRG